MVENEEKENEPSEDERVLQAALRILEKHRRAFEELAK